MRKNIALSRPAMSAIAAFLALSTPAAFAQEAPTVTMTPPVAPTTVPAPAPAPTTTAPPAPGTPAPQPVIRVPVDIVPAEPATKAAEPKAAATAQPKRVAAKPRAAERAPVAPREAAPAAPAAAALAAAPAIEEVAPVAAAVAVPVEPIAEAASAPVEPAATSNDTLPWQIAGGAAALLLVGGIGLTVARRRRASHQVWDFDEAAPNAEWLPTTASEPAASAPAMREEAAVIAPKAEPIHSTTPNFAAAPHGSMGRHEALAMAGPTEDNPFPTLKKRLARARFLDSQERAEYDETLATQKVMTRKPVSAWEIAQRPAPGQASEQEVRRLEPGRARKELKPGWTRN